MSKATIGVLFIKADTVVTLGNNLSIKPLYVLVRSNAFENQTSKMEAFPKRLPNTISSRIETIDLFEKPSNISSLLMSPNKLSVITAIKKEIAG